MHWKPSYFCSLCLLASTMGTHSGAQVNSFKNRVPMRGINSDYVEFAPTISADGKTLIFESNRGQDGWKLYQTKKDSTGAWSTPEPITEINTACDFLAGPNITYDGNYLYFTAIIETNNPSEDIYYSLRIGDAWGPPIRLPSSINTDEYEGFPTVSSNGKHLYFIRLNPDYRVDQRTGEFCFHIFRSTNEQGIWGEPIQLPEEINDGCVMAPRIMADNRTLLFSSLAVEGAGKFDLFQSQTFTDSVWSPPLFLDYVNSAENDLSPAISAAGDTMIFHSQGDLYAVHIPPEFRQFFNSSTEGYVRNLETGEPLAADIIVKDANSMQVVHQSTSNATDGWYSVTLNAGRNYKLEVNESGYLPFSVERNLYLLRGYENSYQDILLRPETDFGVLVFDQDLLIPIAATLAISKEGTPTTTMKVNPELTENHSLQLDIGEYILIASAENYLNDTVKIESSSVNYEPHLKFYLQPEKVKYSFRVRDLASEKRVRSRVIINNQSRDELLEVSSEEDAYLRKGDQYEIQTSGERGYLFASATVLVSSEHDSSSQVDLGLVPVAKNSNLVLHSITFAFNSSDLSAQSLQTLDRLLEFLTLNPAVRIEIAAHTDDYGSDRSNLELSNRRAESVLSYLTLNGVDDKRLVGRGYGERKPLFPNINEENRAENRRVEVKILSVD